ncbi:hypothetical protein RB195_005777 [Necator americanus]|uniref:Uncharacterized protein n=1 Tax=Necator americanus TaxID=51031 RepID=A0ABR1BTC1_NECAM
MGRLKASSPMSFPEWTCGAYLLEATPNRLPCTSQRLLAGPTCWIQGCRESVLAQQKQGLHPLNPPASPGKHKVAFGPRLAPYPPPGDSPRSLATNRL